MHTKPVDTGNINRIVGFATIWDADGMLYFPTQQKEWISMDFRYEATILQIPSA